MAGGLRERIREDEKADYNGKEIKSLKAGEAVRECE